MLNSTRYPSPLPASQPSQTPPPLMMEGSQYRPEMLPPDRWSQPSNSRYEYGLLTPPQSPSKREATPVSYHESVDPYPLNTRSSSEDRARGDTTQETRQMGAEWLAQNTFWIAWHRNLEQSDLDDQAFSLESDSKPSVSIFPTDDGHSIDVFLPIGCEMVGPRLTP